MAKIPIGFRCSTDRYSKYLKIEEELQKVQSKIDTKTTKLKASDVGSEEYKNLTNTINQLSESYQSKKAELANLERNKPQYFKVDFPIPKKNKGKKRKSMQQLLKEYEQPKKLKEWNGIQAKARKERERDQGSTKKSQLAKQKTIADRIYAHELRKMDDTLRQLSNMNLGDECMSKENLDVFISHASEDKDSIVRELADSLISQGVKVWYDEYSLSIGDSLSSSINKGLSECTFGIVILSPNFTKKRWPEVELQSLYAREVHKGKTILPIWHRITFDEVMDFNLHLADKFAFNSATHSVENMTRAIIKELDKKLTDNIS